ncbi:MAG: hypothetical protein GY784_12505, partial [Gammaproteobacteria bacterium]|nr:hypothetical protein [Gammaproteobacteria bacterium]
MKFVLIYAVIGMLSVMTGCSSKPDTRYLEVRSAEHLATPPDLTQISNNEKFEIPANFSSGTGE